VTSPHRATLNPVPMNLPKVSIPPRGSVVVDVTRSRICVVVVVVVAMGVGTYSIGMEYNRCILGKLYINTHKTPKYATNPYQ